MPKNEDLKRLVRARMKKTGKSYTAARAQITGSGNAPPAPRASWPELAGQSDATMRKNTGRDWAEWVVARGGLLHGEGALEVHGHGHPQEARVRGGGGRPRPGWQERLDRLAEVLKR